MVLFSSVPSSFVLALCISNNDFTSSVCGRHLLLQPCWILGLSWTCHGHICSLLLAPSCGRICKLIWLFWILRWGNVESFSFCFLKLVWRLKFWLLLATTTDHKTCSPSMWALCGHLTKPTVTATAQGRQELAEQACVWGRTSESAWEPGGAGHVGRPTVASLLAARWTSSWTLWCS